VGAGAFVIDPLKRVVDTLANAPILAEWVPDSDGVYFFEVLDRSAPKDKGVVMAQDQDNLGNFYFKPLGPSKPIKLMDKEQIKTLRLANLGALFYGNMTLSPTGSKLALWGSDDASKKISSVIYVYDLTGGQKLAFDKPFKTFTTDEGIVTVEWGPDETSLAAVTMTNDAIIRIKLLDVRTGTWKTKSGVKSGVRQTLLLFC